MSDVTAAGRLAGKVAVITGAGSGIGRATALALAADGATVVLLGRRLANLQEVAGEIASARGQAEAMSLDIRDRDQVFTAFKGIAERYEHLDLLVNSAATHSPHRSFFNVTPDDWESIISTNLTGAFNCVQAAMTVMRDQRDGHIISIASVAGIHATVKGGAPYCASKHGVNAIAQLVNLEGWEYGIRGTTIYPGDVDAPMMDTRPTPVPPERRATMLKPEDVASAVIYAATLPKHVVVEDIVMMPLNRASS